MKTNIPDFDEEVINGFAEKKDRIIDLIFKTRRLKAEI